jgi:hypothetical protein
MIRMSDRSEWLDERKRRSLGLRGSSTRNRLCTPMLPAAKSVVTLTR